MENRRKNLNNDFLLRLEQIIKENGGQVALANRAGIPQNTLSQWKNGVASPPFSGMVSVAQAAGVSLEWLATGRGRPGVGPPDSMERAVYYTLSLLIDDSEMASKMTRETMKLADDYASEDADDVRAQADLAKNVIKLRRKG